MRITRYAPLIAAGLLVCSFVPGASEQLPFGGGSALAAWPCQNQLTFNDDGWTGNHGSNGMGGYGSIAEVKTEQSYICTGNSGTSYWHNTISAWAMETDYYATTNYAQAGYIEFNLPGPPPDTHEYFFAEWTDSSCNYVPDPSGTHCLRTWGTTTPGDINWYTAVEDTTDHRINMEINGSVVGYTSYDPSGTWKGPWSSEFNGETHDIGDSLPGFPTTPAQFYSIAYYPTYGSYTTQALTSSQWTLTHNNEPSIYCYKYVNTQQFNIWSPAPPNNC